MLMRVLILMASNGRWNIVELPMIQVKLPQNNTPKRELFLPETPLLLNLVFTSISLYILQGGQNPRKNQRRSLIESSNAFEMLQSRELLIETAYAKYMFDRESHSSRTRFLRS